MGKTSNSEFALAFSNSHHRTGSDLEIPEFTHPLSRLHAEFSHPCRGEEPEFANSGTVMALAQASIKIERLKDGNAVVHLR